MICSRIPKNPTTRGHARITYGCTIHITFDPTKSRGVPKKFFDIRSLWRVNFDVKNLENRKINNRVGRILGSYIAEKVNT
jgi:hypothetical protein